MPACFCYQGCGFEGGCPLAIGHCCSLPNRPKAQVISISFQTAAYLRKATGRAESDVANKLVSMFLHEVSRKICASLDLNISDPKYANVVVVKLGDNCCSGGRPLESDRAAVEHLDGMNRFRAGLPIPGNVIISCKRCNNEIWVSY